jgi:ParB family chromosome partitioning protein
MIGTGSMTMEKVAAIRQVAADHTRSQALRDQATDALKQIDQKAPVDPLFTALRSLVRIDDLQRMADDETEPADARQAADQGVILLRKLEAANAQPAALDKSARAALDRVQAARHPGKPIPVRKPKPEPVPIRRPLKWFTWTWHEMAGWTTQIDVGMVAAGLSDQQWEEFLGVIAETLVFRDTVAGLRQTV